MSRRDASQRAPVVDTNGPTAAAPAPGPGQALRRKSKKKGKKIYKHIPWLNNLLTVLFVAEVLWSLWAFGNRDDLVRYGGSIAFTAVAVFTVKGVSGSVGMFISNLLPWRPLTGNAVNLVKFREQSWQFVAHVLLAAADWAVIWGEPWYTDSRTFFSPPPLEQKIPAGLRSVFMFQMGLWVFTCILHRFLDKRRKDYYVMFAHHVVTIGLVAGSGAYGYFRGAVVILAIHDTSDIAVDFLKLVNYLQLEGMQGLFLTEITFVVNLVVWIYLRLWVFPTRILYGTVVHMHAMLQPAGRNPYPGQPWKDPLAIDISMYWPGNFMLWCLFFMHVWWTFLFLRIAYKLISGEGGHKAGQQEYEGDSEIEGQSTGTELENDVDGRAAR